MFQLVPLEIPIIKNVYKNTRFRVMHYHPSSKRSKRPTPIGHHSETNNLNLLFMKWMVGLDLWNLTLLTG